MVTGNSGVMQASSSHDNLGGRKKERKKERVKNTNRGVKLYARGIGKEEIYNW